LPNGWVQMFIWLEQLKLTAEKQTQLALTI
jgi:hypothetical protein